MADTAPTPDPRVVPANTVAKWGVGLGLPVAGGLGGLLSAFLGVSERVSALEAHRDYMSREFVRVEERIEHAIEANTGRVTELGQEIAELHATVREIRDR